jgi:hypothetical protein
MTPTERATLLLKVQRALDAAGIGRDSLRHDLMPINLNWKTFVNFFSDHVDVVVNDPFESDFGAIATFTFAELFPELEWEDGTLRGYGDSIQSAAIPGYALRIYGGGLLELQNSFDSSQELSLLFRTPERAKRAAQSIADLLAEAGRES